MNYIKQKKGILSYEMIMNIIFIGMFTLIICGSIYYFAGISIKNNLDTEGNEIFPKLKCVLNEENILFKNNPKNTDENTKLYTIDYETYKEISSGIGPKYDAFANTCHFEDERRSTFAFKINLETKDKYAENLKEILDKDVYINKIAYEYYEKILSSKRNTFKDPYKSKGSGGAVMITQKYNVLIIKNGESIPAVLNLNLIIPES